MIEITPEIFDKVDWSAKTITDYCIIYNCTNKSTHHVLFRYTFKNNNKTHYGVSSYCDKHKRINKESSDFVEEYYQELTTKEIFYARLHALH